MDKNLLNEINQYDTNIGLGSGIVQDKKDVLNINNVDLNNLTINNSFVAYPNLSLADFFDVETDDQRELLNIIGLVINYEIKQRNVIKYANVDRDFIDWFMKFKNYSLRDFSASQNNNVCIKFSFFDAPSALSKSLKVEQNKNNNFIYFPMSEMTYSFGKYLNELSMLNTVSFYKLIIINCLTIKSLLQNSEWFLNNYDVNHLMILFSDEHIACSDDDLFILPSAIEDCKKLGWNYWMPFCSNFSWDFFDEDVYYRLYQKLVEKSLFYRLDKFNGFSEISFFKHFLDLHDVFEENLVCDKDLYKCSNIKTFYAFVEEICSEMRVLKQKYPDVPIDWLYNFVDVDNIFENVEE